MRALRLALTCLSLLLLCNACGNGNAGKRTVVLSYGKLSPVHQEVLQAAIDRFEASHSDIRVVLHALEPATDLQRHFYHRSFTAKSAFVDVFEMDTIWTAELAAAGVLATPPAGFGERLERLEAQTLAGATYQGELVAVPAFPAVSVLYYRSDLLTKHGLEIPRTWDALQKTAATIAKAEGIAGYVWQGAAYEGLVCNFLEVYRSHGGTIEVLEEGVALDGSVVTTALNVMGGMVSSGASPSSVLGARESESRDLFLSGEAAFARDWDDLAGFVGAEGSDVAGNVGIALLPGTALHRGVPTLGGWHLAVNQASLASKAAWTLVAELTSAESQAVMATSLGRMPADLSVPLPAREGLTGLDAVRESLAVAVPRPMSPYYHDLSVLLQREVHGVLSGVKDSKDGAKAIVEGARKITLPATASPDFPRALLNPSTVF